MWRNFKIAFISAFGQRIPLFLLTKAKSLSAGQRRAVFGLLEKKTETRWRDSYGRGHMTKKSCYGERATLTKDLWLLTGELLLPAPSPLLLLKLVPQKGEYKKTCGPQGKSWK